MEADASFPASARSFLVIEIKPKQNIGTILRCAVAFGIDALVVIGSHKFGTHGAHGAQKFIPVLHFYYWRNFVAFAETNDIKMLGISTHSVLRETGETGVAVDSYRFLNTEKYAFCVFPTGLKETNVRSCYSVLVVSYPAGPDVGDIVNFDATVSICFQYYRICVARKQHETGIKTEKFILGEQKRRDGVTFMDSETAVSLEESCEPEEDFCLFCFEDLESGT